MPKQIVIAEQHRTAAVFSEEQIQELIVATGSHQVSDIYLGIVENVLPGIDAAFVNIGDSERNGFIHMSDLGPLKLRRSLGPITELLAPQQKVLIQVMKEPTGNKGPRMTGNISLPGRYLVLMPFGRGVNLSRRIRNESERNRLRALAILIKPAGMGLLVRTEAEGMDEDSIIEDLELLQKQWESIQQEAMSTRAPSLLNRDDDFIQRVLRDMYTADVNRIVVDSHMGMKRVKQHLANWSGGKPPQGVLIDHHRDRISILEYFRVNAAIREALKPRVDLPSGGYIIIEPTEALTVIDVNSGSFTRSASSRETVLWTNYEAAAEIARQLRLRNLAGVIIVDFIDMDSRRDQLQVLEHFNKALRADKARPQIAQLTELGLVELTRKRQGQNIYELFGRSCSVCGGLGHLVHLPGDEPNAVMRVVPEITRDSPTLSSDSSLPPQLRDSRDSSNGDETDDDSDLELINHPSYRDRNNNNNRRRRRRRVVNVSNKSSGRSSRTPIPDTDSSKPAAPIPKQELRSEPSPAAEPGDSSEPESRSSRDSSSRDSSSRDSSSRDSRSDRGRSRREKGSSTPTEVISIKMTPEEQDLYALMGISPLVLSTQGVKDSKNAVIDISSPGEARSTERSMVVDAEELSKKEAAVTIDETDVDNISNVDETDETDETEDSEDTTAETPKKGKSETSSSSRRRRRRRSSASSSRR
jgi:ribonuclease E